MQGVILHIVQEDALNDIGSDIAKWGTKPPSRKGVALKGPGVEKRLLLLTQPVKKRRKQ